MALNVDTWGAEWCAGWYFQCLCRWEVWWPLTLLTANRSSAVQFVARNVGRPPPYTTHVVCVCPLLPPHLQSTVRCKLYHGASNGSGN